MTRFSVAAACVASLLLMQSGAIQAQTGDSMTTEEFEAKLGYQTGSVTLQDGLATLRLPDSLRFLNADGSRRLLVDGWGNPPDAAESVLGMIIPASASPLSKDGWGIVITYDEDGYVNDADAAKIDYDKLLKQMRESTVATNEARKKDGFEPVTLVGWAEKPSYDAAAHKLYWAKELQFGANPEHTLNYNIRVLGRRGVLILNAVASMQQLALVRSQAPAVLAAVDFNEGHRYTDYLPGKDKAAAYGVAGLVLGATAAKAGVFKVLLAAILAFKKVILAALIAGGAMLKQFFSRKRTVDAGSEPPAADTTGSTGVA
jgi:uncharacterized membrane-anchored protein